MASGPWPFLSTPSVCSFDSNGQLAEGAKNETNVDLEEEKDKNLCKHCLSAPVKETGFSSTLKYCLVVRDVHSC